MSREARWLIAIVNLITAVGLVFVSHWVPSALCVLVAVACLPSTTGSLALRTFGAMLFLAPLVVIVNEFVTPHFFAPHLGKSGIVQALFTFLSIGIWGGYVAVTGHLPKSWKTRG